MDLGSLFIILALLILVALFVTRPFFEAPQAAAELIKPQEDHALSTLLAERERVLAALQEMDFDYALGKIPPEDYPIQRSALVSRGADILRQLDELRASSGLATSSGAEEAVPAAGAAIPEAHTSLSSGAAGAKQAMATVAIGGGLDFDDRLENLLAERRKARREKAAGFCHRCGGALQKSDQFCPKCGAKTI